MAVVDAVCRNHRMYVQVVKWAEYRSFSERTQKRDMYLLSNIKALNIYSASGRARFKNQGHFRGKKVP